MAEPHRVWLAELTGTLTATGVKGGSGRAVRVARFPRATYAAILREGLHGGDPVAAACMQTYKCVQRHHAKFSTTASTLLCGEAGATDTTQNLTNYGERHDDADTRARIQTGTNSRHVNHHPQTSATGNTIRGCTTGDTWSCAAPLPCANRSPLRWRRYVHAPRCYDALRAPPDAAGGITTCL